MASLAEELAQYSGGKSTVEPKSATPRGTPSAGRKSLSEELVAYTPPDNTAAPEGGIGHYLGKGAIEFLSSFPDAVPNLYNLAKGVWNVSNAPDNLAALTNRQASDFRLDLGVDNPIKRRLLNKAGLDTPVTPAPYLGDFGAAVVEGIGSGGLIGLEKLPFDLAAKIVAEKGLSQAAKQAAVNAALGVSRNAAIGGAASGGAELGAKATDGNPLGSLAGGAIGGVLAPSSFIGQGGLIVGGARAGRKTLIDMKNSKAAQALSDRAEPVYSNYVSRTLRNAAEGAPNSAENLTTGLMIQDKIPGLNLSVGEMSGAPGLLDMQKKFALLNPKNTNTEAARMVANEQAIKNAYASLRSPVASPSVVRSAVNQSLADEQSGLLSGAQDIAKKLPTADQYGLGTKLGEIAQTEKKAAQPAITSAYEKAFNLAPESSINAAPILSSIEHATGVPLAQLKPEVAPRTFAAISRFLKGDGALSPEELAYRSSLFGGNIENAGTKATMTLREAADLRKAINADASMASRSTDALAATRLKNIGDVKQTIDDSIANSPISDTAKTAFNDANAKYATEYAPRFKEGANLRMFKDSSVNEPKILPDKAIAEYFKPDTQSGITRAIQFGKLFGQNPEAKNAAETGIMDIYRNSVVNPTTGVIDQTAHNRFMQDYGRTLSAFKANGVNVADNIKNIGQQAAKSAETMNSLNSLAKSMKFDTTADLTAHALQSPKMMGNTLGRLNPETRQAFGTLLLDKAMENGTASGMKNYLETNKTTLKMALPAEHLSAMNDIASALEMMERAPLKGSIAAGGPDMLKNLTGTSTATVASQIRAVTGGRSSIEWGAINLSMPALNKMTQTSFGNVMEEAMHSKESATALRNYLLSTTPKEANSWASKFWAGAKSGGRLAIQSAPVVIKNFVGPEKFKGNIGTSSIPISTQMQNQQEQQQ